MNTLNQDLISELFFSFEIFHSPRNCADRNIKKRAATSLYIWSSKTAPKITVQRLEDKHLPDRRFSVKPIVSFSILYEDKKKFMFLKIRGKIKSEGAKSISQKKKTNVCSFGDDA